jgi:hypothetical protein
MKPSKGGAARRGLAIQSTGGPIGPRNAVQRVADRVCVVCGGPVVRSARGPAPAACVACGGHLRALRQLRAYFASAERLARSLGQVSVAALAHEAADAIEREAAR